MRRIIAPVWSVLEYGWYPLIAFISTPYLLHTLGPDKYGQLILLVATIGFGGFLNGGTGAAVIKLVSANQGRITSRSIQKILSGSLAMAIAGGLVLSIIVLLIFFAGSISFFEKMGSPAQIRYIGIFAGLLIFIEQIDNVFSSFLKGQEKFSLAAQLEIVSKSIQIIGSVLTVTISKNINYLFSTLVLIALIRLIFKAYITSKKFHFASLQPDFRRLNDVLAYAKWGWVQGIGGMFFGLADRMLVGSLLGASSLTHYSVATQLAQQIHGLSASAFSVLFPKVSRQIESGNGFFSLWDLSKIALVSNLAITSILACSLLIFGNEILYYWLGSEEAKASTQILWYLTIAYWILGANVALHFILLGMGKMRYIALLNLVAGIIFVITAFIFLPILGLIGAAYARMIYGTITLIGLMPIYRFLIKEARQESSIYKG